MSVLSHVLSPEERARSPLPKSVTRRRLDDMWLHVNFPCNLACTHCLFSCNPHYAGGIPDLTLAQACGYTGEAQAAGATTFYVTGGEPLMWRPLREFLTWYFERPEARPLVILTNGTLIGEKWARFFAPLHALGLELRVSLECYSEDINDRWRGAGSHALAMKGLRQLNAVGIQPTIAFTSKSETSFRVAGKAEIRP